MNMKLCRIGIYHIPEQTKVCNCAGCGCLLLGEKSVDFAAEHRHRYGFPAPVSERVNGRPYCSRCMQPDKVRCGGGRRLGKHMGDEDQALEQIVRQLEDAADHLQH